MSRHVFVIGVRPEKHEEYKRLHAAVWPEVLAVLKQVNISDYTIFHKDNVLFGAFDYTGTDLAADYTAMNATPIIKLWYTVCEPCQQPLETRRPGEWWAEMDTIFHMDRGLIPRNRSQTWPRSTA